MRAVILLVDDDAGDQELTRRAFAEAPVDLRIVSDGAEAIDYLRRQGNHAVDAPRPDIILLDLNMPRLDGREVLRRIRADAQLKDLVVIVLTTSDQDVDARACYALHCNSFITKPVRVETFTAAMHEIGAYWFELATLPPV